MPKPEFVVKIPGVGEIAGSGTTGLAALALCLLTLLGAGGLIAWLLVNSEALQHLLATRWPGVGQ